MDDFNFYNSENDGYRGGFGDYVDPAPAGQPQYRAPQPEGPRKKKHRAVRIAALLLACAVVGAGTGVGRGLDANDPAGPVAAALRVLEQLGPSGDDD